MKNGTTFPMHLLVIALGTCVLLTGTSFAQIDNPDRDNTLGLVPPNTNPHPGQNRINIVTSSDGYDNFDLGVDFAEPHMSTNPLNPLWWFNAFNTNGTHHTQNGYDWTTNNPSFPSAAGDPVTAYDSLGNLYYMTMKNPITGTWVVKSTNNGLTWGAFVSSVAGVDKCWMAADQTTGPYANYLYTTMTSGTVGSGNFARSTDLGATFVQTFTATTQSLPGMMVCVGPNVLGGNNVSGGCVYVVTNSGSSTASTYTFYRSTNGGATFTSMSSQIFANYVGTFVSGRNSVQNMRTRPYPFVTADNSYGGYRGRLYLVYASNNPSGDGNKPDVYCRYSTDQGTTWSAATIINDDANSQNNHQWHPSIWCDKETGRLYAKWLDTRRTPTSDSCEVYSSYSDDGGVTWLPNQVLSNAKMKIDCPTCGGGGTPRYEGDYDAITSNRNGAMAVWSDFRNGTFLSVVGYFPDFAMLASPVADTIGLDDSLNIVVKVPSVKLYSRSVKFSATVSPSANFTFSFLGNKDSLTSYPDSVVLKIRTNNVPQGVYSVTITGQGPEGAAIHKRTVTISALPALVAVLQPNGGEQLFVGTDSPISWVKNRVDTVKIEYSTDNGTTWILISPGVPARPIEIIPPKLRARGNHGPTEASLLALYNWRVPNTPSPNCLVRISDKNNPGLFDVSNAPFSIVAAPAPHWTAQTSGTAINLNSVSVVDTSLAWAAGDSGRVYRTANGGGTWLQRTPVTNAVSSIVAVSATVALVAANATGSARILRTPNGGLGWTTAYQDTSTDAFIDAIRMFDANNGYAIGDPVNGRWTLLRTTNGGTSWFSQDTLLQAETEFGWGKSMSWIGGQYGWFGTSNSRVYRTSNGGTNWLPAATTFANSYAVSFSNNQLGIAAGTGTERSSDGGSSWANTPAQPPSPIFGLAAIPGSPDRWYAVASSSVYKSTDHGASWPAEFSQGNLYEAIDMTVATAGGNTWLVGYAVGDNGTITKYIELLLPTNVGPDNPLVPDQFVLDQNYPNPFNPSTTITYALPEQANVRLRIFDILGQEVRTLVNTAQPSGRFQQTWDGRNNAAAQVASGMYYYRLEAVSLNGNHHIGDRKMLLLK